MADIPNLSGHPGPASPRADPRKPVRATRVPRPAACGCGLAVEFDLDKQEFFCIGCGGAEECVCLRSRLTSIVRPVRVA